MKAGTKVIEVRGQQPYEVIDALISEGIWVNLAFSPRGASIISIIVSSQDVNFALKILRRKYGEQCVDVIPVVMLTFMDDRRIVLRDNLADLEQASFYVTEQHLYLEVDDE